MHSDEVMVVSVVYSSEEERDVMQAFMICRAGGGVASAAISLWMFTFRNAVERSVNRSQTLKKDGSVVDGYPKKREKT